VPGSLPRDAIGRVWTSVKPHETVLLQGEQDVLPVIALERVRHRHTNGMTVLHLMAPFRRVAAAAG